MDDQLIPYKINPWALLKKESSDSPFCDNTVYHCHYYEIYWEKSVCGGGTHLISVMLILFLKIWNNCCLFHYPVSLAGWEIRASIPGHREAISHFPKSVDERGTDWKPELCLARHFPRMPLFQVMSDIPHDPGLQTSAPEQSRKSVYVKLKAICLIHHLLPLQSTFNCNTFSWNYRLPFHPALGQRIYLCTTMEH